MASVTCKVSRTGNSATVTLPYAWRKRNGVEFGDVLEAITDVDGQITFVKADARPSKKAVDRYLAVIDSLPDIPWEGDATPADDRRMLGERYA